MRLSTTARTASFAFFETGGGAQNQDGHLSDAADMHAAAVTAPIRITELPEFWR